jgi:pilus assembly protein CpaB
VRVGNGIILVVAVGMGLGAALLARSWVQGRVQTTNDVTAIVVAGQQLDFGTELSADKLTELPWAAGTLPQGAFATKQDLLKDGRRVALAPIGRHEPVLRSKITGSGQRGSLSSLLEEGKRAVTVRVDDVKGVAGFILPADHVDVVLIRNENSGGSRSYSDLILQNVKVLAIDQAINEKPNQAAALVRAVTLEVTAEQAQKVLLAVNVGKLSLVLQKAGSASGEQVRRITEKDLAFPERADTASAPVVTAPARTGLSTVSIIRGMKREEYTVKETR